MSNPRTVGAAAARALATRLLGTMEGLLAENVTARPVGDLAPLPRDVILKHIEVIRGEADKLGRGEAVLAVVGTMKSGKSTTINAIVGAEVLPTRNRPMTTLPTVIRHAPGQRWPVLRFDNAKPLLDLAAALRLRIGALELSEERRSDAHLQDLLLAIEKGWDFKPRYEGAAEIAEFLRDINDLARLASEASLDFPVAAYDELHEMPLVEVEFAHIGAREDERGGLALLDTPGPNEYKQSALRRIVKDQLAKATAILTVLDYTQLKSEADAQVRQDVAAVREVVDGQIYVLVNKFDERGSQGDDLAELQGLVADELFPGMVPKDRILPVSARLAYLSTKARRADWPRQSNAEDWAADFGREAFGPRWREKLDDGDAVRGAAEALWAGSKFETVIETVRALHGGATDLAVRSAVAKVGDSGADVQRLLSTRLGEARREIDAVRAEINAGEAEASRWAEGGRAEVAEAFERALAQFAANLTNAVEAVKERCFDELCTLVKKHDGAPWYSGLFGLGSLGSDLQKTVESVRTQVGDLSHQVRQAVAQCRERFEEQLGTVVGERIDPWGSVAFEFEFSLELDEIGKFRRGRIFDDVLAKDGGWRHYYKHDFHARRQKLLKADKLQSVRDELGLAVLIRPWRSAPAYDVGYKLRESAAHWLAQAFSDVLDDIQERVVVPVRWQVAIQLGQWFSVVEQSQRESLGTLQAKRSAIARHADGVDSRIGEIEMALAGVGEHEDGLPSVRDRT